MPKVKEASMIPSARMPFQSNSPLDSTRVFGIYFEAATIRRAAIGRLIRKRACH